mgnify:CR=1 FL=1
MMPRIFGENLVDDFMNEFAFPDFTDNANIEEALYGKHEKNLIKTDVKDTENGYEVDIDLPGFKKDEITMKLENGTLTVSAAKGLDKDEENKEKTYVRRERYAGGMSRSFYVGDEMKQEDIKAKFENGVLKITVPKKEEKPVVENNSYITIEG